MKAPLLVNDFLDRAETVFRDRVGVIDEPDAADNLGSLTYGEVARRVRALQAGLDELGIDAGERIAVVSPNSARLLELFYAVPSSGRVLVPINFRLRSEEVEYIVDHSGASVLLVDPEFDDDLGTVTAKHRLLLGAQSDEALLRFDREPQPWRDADEDATATINYTSGTTARPKGVQITHRNIYMNSLTFGWHAAVTDRDVYLHTLPQFHANGWGMLYTAPGAGAPQVVLRKVDGPEILRRVGQHGVTFMCAAPAVVNAVHDEGYLTISDRKKDVIITGGENVSSIEVEDCLYSLEGVAECAVIGVPDEKWGETIKAIVVLAPGATLDEAAVIAHCKQKMAGYKSPTSVDIVEVIPRTATGKVQKFKLRE